MANAIFCLFKMDVGELKMIGLLACSLDILLVWNFWISFLTLQLLAIRDELFDTFRKRHKGVMEYEEVQLTQDSLHRSIFIFLFDAFYPGSNFLVLYMSVHRSL